MSRFTVRPSILGSSPTGEKHRGERSIAVGDLGAGHADRGELDRPDRTSNHNEIDLRVGRTGQSASRIDEPMKIGELTRHGCIDEDDTATARRELSRRGADCTKHAVGFLAGRAPIKSAGFEHPRFLRSLDRHRSHATDVTRARDAITRAHRVPQRDHGGDDVLAALLEFEAPVVLERGGRQAFRELDAPPVGPPCRRDLIPEIAFDLLAQNVAVGASDGLALDEVFAPVPMIRRSGTEVVPLS